MFEIQGLIFAIGSLIFAISLFPSVKQQISIPLWTSVPTATILWINTVTYFTMGDAFYYALFTSGFTAFIWTVLIYIRIDTEGWNEYGRNHNSS